MLGVTVYNHQTINQKNSEILVLQKEQGQLDKRIKDLNETLKLTQTQIKATDDAYKALSVRLGNLDQNKSNYTNKVKEIRDENEDTRRLLDTRLPDDLKRLLNEAVQVGKQ